MNKEKRSLLKNDGVQSFIASIICILLGLLLGYVVLLFINPAGAGEAITSLVKNFFNYPNTTIALKYFGSTLADEVPRQYPRQDRAAADVLAVDPVCV